MEDECVVASVVAKEAKDGSPTDAFKNGFVTSLPKDEEGSPVLR